ncbi:DUF2334 domain-containing protein [Aneurinibacillus uraniidurans]|uniref:DUF2334 domain-containing protein n=1 Tax=Aneurinibacillus uraniidurans TaxID=2966586 RepID=UPI00234AD5DB|nr:DUF2334 domain-containing protein [Aneurinibacillus sp. B1]WCN36369.1 DUF2334 domain-containing protein [Aneurinibacillus sp. B1]
MKRWGLILLLIAVLASPFPSIGRTNELPNYSKGYALLRLEDITPGSPYRSPEELGRLRAVFTYLQEQNVPFSVAVIPRAVSIGGDGSRYDHGFDDEKPAENVRQLARLLRDAQAKGAVLGMHGYTHQYGDRSLPDGTQNTGVGFEFNVAGVPDTKTTSYAAERIEKSLRAFDRVGLVPAFWESPHYTDTRAQEEVFRSYMGILYQPDFHSLVSLRDMNVYETTNTYHKETAGSVYVPAPLSYVHAGHSSATIVKKLQTYKGLASLFYHPYLEFGHMEPVHHSDGTPVMQDGLPLYRYRAGETSGLQQLVAGVRKSGFTWMSLHEVVPFTPAHRLSLSGAPVHLMTGDVTGSGFASLVIDDGSAIYVQMGDFRWPRNRSQPDRRCFLRHAFGSDEILTLADISGDGRKDLLSYDRKSGRTAVFESTGTSFAKARAYGQLPPEGVALLTGDFDGDGHEDVLWQNATSWKLMRNTNGQFTVGRTGTIAADAVLLTGDIDGDGVDEWMEVSSSSHMVHIFRDRRDFKTNGIALKSCDQWKNIQWLTGDTNGDGKCDLIAYDPASGLWDVWQSTGSSFTKLLPTYGPWARGGSMALCADFDGNGRADIGVWETKHQGVDISLSFQPNKR